MTCDSDVNPMCLEVHHVSSLAQCVFKHVESGSLFLKHVKSDHCICMGVWPVCVSASVCAWYLQRLDRTGLLIATELVLQTVVSHHVDAGNTLRFSGGAVSALYC